MSLDILPIHLQSGIDHRRDCRVDRLALHRHEIHQSVVEIEYDCFDHHLLQQGFGVASGSPGGDLRDSANSRLAWISAALRIKDTVM